MNNLSVDRIIAAFAPVAQEFSNINKVLSVHRIIIGKSGKKGFTGSGAFYKNRLTLDGAWPSGKAPVFGIGIRRFDPCRPSQLEKAQHICAGLF
jgi:hypothetical protein